MLEKKRDGRQRRRAFKGEEIYLAKEVGVGS